MRIRDWRIAFLFLLLCGLVESSFGGNQCETPLLPHEDQSDQREFQNAYQCITAPTISTGTVIGRLTVPNGVNATDAAAYGQFAVFQSSCVMTNVETDITATSYQALTNQSVTITPSSASHHVIFWGHLSIQNPDNSTICFITVKEGGTDLSHGLSRGFGFAYTGTSTIGANVPFSGVDLPGQTGSTTYQLYGQSNNSGHSCAFGNANSIATLCVAETK